MTVMENLEMGTYARPDRKSKAVKDDLERVFELFPRLKERSNQAAGSMSGGEQQMLAMGRALMAKPRLLLLDEPSMGLAPKLIQQIFDIVTEINSQGTTVLLVEQNAAQALKRSHRAYILETGEIVREGTGRELARRPGRQGGLPRRRRLGPPASAATASAQRPLRNPKRGATTAVVAPRSGGPTCPFLFRPSVYGRSLSRVTSGPEREE